MASFVPTVSSNESLRCPIAPGLRCTELGVGIRRTCGPPLRFKCDLPCQHTPVTCRHRSNDARLSVVLAVTTTLLGEESVRRDDEEDDDEIEIRSPSPPPPRPPRPPRG